MLKNLSSLLKGRTTVQCRKHLKLQHVTSFQQRQVVDPSIDKISQGSTANRFGDPVVYATQKVAEKFHYRPDSKVCIFKRSSLAQTTQKLVNPDFPNGSYICYYAPSGTGKTTAILNCINGRPGVIYISLRTLSVNDAILLALGPEHQQMDAIFRLWKVCQAAAKALGHRVLVVVEDINAVLDSQEGEQLAKTLLELYKADVATVIYTISEQQGVTKLNAVSGHASRLKVLDFPGIDDQDLEQQLQQITFVRNTNSDEFYMASDNLQTTERYHFSPSTAAGIVSIYGNQMTRIQNILLQMATDSHVKLQETMDEDIEQEMTSLFWFISRLDSTTATVIHVLLTEFMRLGDRPIEKALSFLRRSLKIPMNVLSKPVSYCTNAELVSHSGLDLKLNRRITKFAYARLLELDQDFRREREELLGSFSLDTTVPTITIPTFRNAPLLIPVSVKQ